MISSQGEEVEHDDLYGDLTRSKPQNCQNRIILRPPTKQAFNHNSEELMSKLQAKLDETKKENEILKRNIGTLYRTAKLELERKDARIMALQEHKEYGKSSRRKII